MRLLDVRTFQLQSGIPDQSLPISEAQIWPQTNNLIPQYAILSHRWMDEEIVFDKFHEVSKARFADLPPRNPVPQDAESTSIASLERHTSSVYKIAGACRQVRDFRDKTVKNIWIDTVCIDKSDAQELGIAINSMFRWYENAEVCFVYLVDVSWTSDNDEVSREQFRNSQWFKRGWTLQELLAPKKLEFYDRDWNFIGSKEKLAKDICQTTGISHDHLLGGFRRASLAQKISWLAGRETKFLADMSYCLIGILGVGNLKGLFMDTRYSQGQDEFRRLQIEIIKKWDDTVPFDESLFAWKSDKILSSGLLAPAPSCFRDCGNVIFDPELAKLRVPHYIRNSNMSIVLMGTSDMGISFDGQNNMTFVANPVFHFPLGLPFGGIVMGLITFPAIIPFQLHQISTRHRDVMLNCWVLGKDNRPKVQKIKLKKGKDNTWQRVDCGTLQSTACSWIYPSRLVAETVPIALKITNSLLMYP